MYKQDFILIDVETTGTSTFDGYETIQLAAIRLDKETLIEKASYSTLVRPENPGHVSPIAMKIHGIPMEKLLMAPTNNEALDGFIKSMYKPEELENPAATTMLAAHNAKFDWEFLGQMLKRSGLNRDKFGYHIFDFWTAAVDRCALLGIVPPGGKYSLQNLAEYFHLARSDTHDALQDVRVAAEVFRQLGARCQNQKRGAVPRLHKKDRG